MESASVQATRDGRVQFCVTYCGSKVAVGLPVLNPFYAFILMVEFDTGKSSTYELPNDTYVTNEVALRAAMDTGSLYWFQQLDPKTTPTIRLLDYTKLDYILGAVQHDQIVHLDDRSETKATAS